MSCLQKGLAFLAGVGLVITAESCNDGKTRYSTVEVVKEVPAPPAPVKSYYPFTDAQPYGGRIFNPENILEPYAPPGYWRALTPRIKVWFPHFLTGRGDLIDGAINEIMTVAPEAGYPGLDYSLRGVDPDPSKYPPVVVVIMDPTAYSLADDSKALSALLVGGNWATYNTPQESWDILYVAWRTGPGSAKYLPALSHELLHRLTRDLYANH